jgi:hypothetical protein
VAALLLAIVAGVQIMRQMIGLSAFATCSTRGVDEDIGTGISAAVDRRGRFGGTPATTRVAASWLTSKSPGIG